MNAHIIDKVALALLNHSRASVGKKPLASLGDYDGVSHLTGSRVENIDANTWRERAIVALETSGWDKQVDLIERTAGCVNAVASEFPALELKLILPELRQAIANAKGLD